MGKKTGSYKSYFPDGSLSAKGEFLKDQEIGVWEYYGEHGKPIKRTTYQRGKVVEELEVR